MILFSLRYPQCFTGPQRLAYHIFVHTALARDEASLITRDSLVCCSNALQAPPGTVGSPHVEL